MNRFRRFESPRNVFVNKRVLNLRDRRNLNGISSKITRQAAANLTQENLLNNISKEKNIHKQRYWQLNMPHENVQPAAEYATHENNIEYQIFV